MTHLIERTALILLAGTALSVSLAGNALAQAVVADAPSAVAAPGVDAFARARRHRAAPAAADAATYKVRRGDTLATIAGKLGTSVETLARANGLKKPYRVDAGQVLKTGAAQADDSDRAPAKSSGKKGGKAGAETYVVKSGDTLFSLAKRFGTTVEALRAQNGMGRSSSLTPGRKLTVHGGGAAEAAEDESPPPPRARNRRQVAEPEVTVEPPGRAVAGRVVEIALPGKAYRVRKGDTLAEVADRLGTSVSALAKTNHLKKPYRLRRGQTIRGGGGGTVKAYVVARGDTLATIAERFDVTVDKLRAANGLRRGAAVAPGRKLRLPAGYHDTGPLRVFEPDQSREPAPFRNPPGSGRTPRGGDAEGLPNRPQPYVPPRPYPRPPSGPLTDAPTASPQVSDAQITQMGRGLFQWPIRGQVISSFGDKGTSQRNDGLNIRANAGDPVRAAASGDVVYAGDLVPGFGNLVLIKHADGWVTAYGHLGKVDVRMQQKVTQGQAIGEAGSSGGVSEPQLHFEVRYAPTPQERARPIDPSLVLPR